MKICYRCKELRPLEDYYKDSSKKDGRTPYCKSCRKEKAHEQYLKNPQLARDRASRLRAEAGIRLDVERMGLTMKEYTEKLIAQDFKCAICKQEESATQNGVLRRLSIDHDHSCCTKNRNLCGKCNRDLLCNRCNKTLGFVNDDPELLQKMITYLNEHRNKI